MSPPAEQTVVTYYSQHEDNYKAEKVREIAGLSKTEQDNAIRRIERNHGIVHLEKAEEVYRSQASISGDVLDRMTANRIHQLLEEEKAKPD